MENVEINQGMPNGKHARIAFGRQRCHPRKSLQSPLLMNGQKIPVAPSPAFSEFPKFVDNYDLPKDQEKEQHTKKRLSLGTIARQRQDLELMKQSIALDSEIEYLNSTMDEMETNFKRLFAEATYRRLRMEYRIEHGKEARKFNYHAVVKKLPLQDHPHVEWATMIEEAIRKYIY